MLEAKASQFTLSAEGQILWQEKLNNPLPGVAVAFLEKGESALKPVLNILDNEHTAKYDNIELKNNLNIWLNDHFSTVLEPLVLLEVPQGAAVNDDAVSVIADRVYRGLGIVPRGELEDVISKLTPETRVDLRAKKIRLGPILAFIPALNKPAAVKLRALLWSLFNDKGLPAKTPADGIVSAKIDDTDANEDYYRSIGYPLYGGRAVRIDMLDRVISCVYDNAKEGKFQARHEMAEWLGCSIDDLYKVLVSMGHTKVFDPADEAEKDTPETEAPKEKGDETDQADKEKSPVASKPELATFRLKKGKAFKQAGSGKPGFKNAKSSKPNKPKKDDKKKSKRKEKSPRIMSVEAKVNDEDSPFAILQQLKK